MAREISEETRAWVRDWLSREHPDARITPKGLGYLAAYGEAKITSNPYEVGSDEWFEWLRGFAIGAELTGRDSETYR